MRRERLFSLIVVIGAMAMAITLASRAGDAASQTVSTSTSALPKNLDRGPELRAQDTSQPSNATALDPHERNPWLNEYWQGQRAAENALRRGAVLDQQTRDAIRARWLALYSGTNRTCVLLCGGE